MDFKNIRDAEYLLSLMVQKELITIEEAQLYKNIGYEEAVLEAEA